LNRLASSWILFYYIKQGIKFDVHRSKTIAEASNYTRTNFVQ
jgi:hypothetical protein